MDDGSFNLSFRPLCLFCLISLTFSLVIDSNPSVFLAAVALFFFVVAAWVDNWRLLADTVLSDGCRLVILSFDCYILLGSRRSGLCLDFLPFFVVLLLLDVEVMDFCLAWMSRREAAGSLAAAELFGSAAVGFVGEVLT